MRHSFKLLLLVLSFSGLLSAQGPPKQIPNTPVVPSAKQTQAPAPTQASTRPTCADPAVEFTATPSPIQSTTGGIVVLTGKVCNKGTADYAGKMDARITVVTFHPPHTPAQEGDSKVFSDDQIGPSLKKGECKDVRQRYPAPNAVSWGKPTLRLPADHRPVVKLFALCALKDPSTGANFTSQENCNQQNDCIEVAVPYVEKF